MIRITDPGVKKAPNPGSRIRIRNTAKMQQCPVSWYQPFCHPGAPVFLTITNLGEVLRSGEKGAEGTGELIFNDMSEM
jgi:hypothetical protein